MLFLKPHSNAVCGRFWTRSEWPGCSSGPGCTISRLLA